MTMWMMQTSDGEYLWSLAERTRAAVIAEACGVFVLPWTGLKRAGYRPVQVRVTRVRQTRRRARCQEGTRNA